MKTPKCVAKRDSGVGSLGAQDCGWCVNWGQTHETWGQQWGTALTFTEYLLTFISPERPLFLHFNISETGMDLTTPSHHFFENTFVFLGDW